MASDDAKHVESYDTGQPFLERLDRSVERTRLSPEQEPRVVLREDGVIEINVPVKKSSDSVGTKAVLHWRERTFGQAAQDAYAMVANDLIRDRCEPLLLTNTVSMERQDDDAIAELVEGLADRCVERGVQIYREGNETAILDTIQGFELQVDLIGAVVDHAENRYRPGNVLVGIPSSGMHSNGFSDARRLFGEDWPRELLAPTRIYDEVLELVKAGYPIDGLTHVTGDGLMKMRTDGLDFIVTRTHLTPSSDIFMHLWAEWMLESGDEDWVDEQMHRKFNSGIGFVLGVPEHAVGDVMTAIPDARTIGEVREGDGRVIVEQSQYTGRRVVLERPARR